MLFPKTAVITVNVSSTREHI